MFDQKLDDKAAQSIFEILKDFWVQNGDIISLQYTGAESNISTVTKHDKKGYSGKVEQWKVGIERYYQNIMNDYFKNECVLFL